MKFFPSSWLDDPTDESTLDYAAIAERPTVEDIYPPVEEAPIADPDLPPANPNPAPVVIRPRKASSWSTWRVNLEANRPQQIAGQQLGRTSLLVRNLDAAQEVTLGPDDNVDHGFHWPLAAAATTTFDHTGEVWAVADGAAVLVLLAEYDIEKGGS